VVIVHERTVALVIGAIIILFLVLPAGGMMGPGMMGWGSSAFNPWWGVLTVLFWVLIVGGIALLVAWFVRQGPASGAPSNGRDSRAMEILRERYARGEISHEEFERMRGVLES
jgi:putative membrane protein